MINKELQDYVEKEILPSYQKNDEGHNLEHIKYVLKRSLKFAKTISDISYDMVYTIAAYHDIGHYIDAKNHESVSSKMLLADQKLKSFFNKEQIQIMAEAIYDHRAGLEYEPRSIYGKIISSANRNNLMDSIIKRAYSYRLEHMPHASLEEKIEDSRLHIMDKYGSGGYAKEKMYFVDEDYQIFLEECDSLTGNLELFRKRYIEVNHLENKLLQEQIQDYVPINEQEEMDKEAILRFICTFEDTLTRTNIFGHFSASAFVVNEDFTKTLLVKHNIYGGFIYPGGHADGEYELLEVAVREVKEETGLEVKPVMKDIFAIQSLPIKGHVKRGTYVPAHIHYDILYLLMAKNDDMDKISILETENSQVQWVDLEESYNDEAIDWIKPVQEKIVEKVKRLGKR